MTGKTNPIFLLILLCLCNYTNAQMLLFGTVSDSATQHYLPYANIYIEGTTTGVISDEAGNFKLLIPDSLLSRNIIVSMMGYISSYTKASSFKKATFNKISLRSQNTILSEVIISPANYCKYKQFSWGAQKAHTGKINFVYGNEIAAYMSNSSQQKGIIKTIRFYITKDGYPTQAFGAMLYGVDTKTNGPGKNLIDTCFILSAKKGNEWVELDISKYNILIPAEGFYIAMEWLPGSMNYLYTIKGSNANNPSSGQSLGAAKKTEGSKTFVKNYLSGWSDFSFLFNAAIGADVLVSDGN